MRRRSFLPIIVALGLWLPCLMEAQVTRATSASDATVRRAVGAYGDLDYAGAVTASRLALRGQLSAADQARAWQTLGFAYASLDSARQAIEALKQFILLDPERDLDPSRVSPKITSLYALALGQVLVIRHVRTEAGVFVTGTSNGGAFAFTVTRPAYVRTRLTGPGGAVVLDSALHDGPVRVAWNGLVGDGRAAQAGRWRLVIEATAGRDSYATALPLDITVAPVDTAPHLTTLPGYDLLPEQVVPPRSLRPTAAAAIAVGAAVVGSVALQPGGLSAGNRHALIAVSGGTLIAGLLATLKHPAPVPSASNIRYNTLVQAQLERENASIATANGVRRTQVRLSITAANAQTQASGR